MHRIRDIPSGPVVADGVDKKVTIQYKTKREKLFAKALLWSVAVQDGASDGKWRLQAKRTR